jgi:hypothetical protein
MTMNIVNIMNIAERMVRPVTVYIGRVFEIIWVRFRSTLERELASEVKKLRVGLPEISHGLAHRFQ